MEKNLLFIIGGAAMLSAMSCSVEENKIDPVPSDPRVPMEFTAGVYTKTSIDSDNSVAWSENDAVSIFDGTNNNEFTITAGQGTSSATFTGEALPDADYYALYPYSAEASISGTVISSVLPAEQHFVDRTFDTMLNPSVAVADGDNNLAFHNVASILQVKVFNITARSVSSIAVKADKSLTGAYTVEMSGGTFSAQAAGSEILGATLVAGESGTFADIDGDGAIIGHIVVLPGEYSDMTITVNYADGAVSEVNIPSVTMPVSGGNYLDINAEDAEMPGGLYARYQAGEDIEIGGKIYNKSEYGEATLISTDAEIVVANSETLSHPDLEHFNPQSNDGIYFIESGVTVYMNYAGAMKRFFLIGNDPESKSTVVPETYFRTNAKDVENGELLIYNIDIDYSGQSTYMITQNNETAGIIRIIDSRVALPAYPLIACTSAGRSYSEIDLQGSTFKLNGGTNFVNMSSNTATMPSISFKNNIFYAADITSNYVFYAGTSSSIGKVTLENNTFVNIHNTTSGMFRYGTLSEVELRSNLVYLETQTTGVCFFRPQDVSAGTGETYVGNPKKGVCEESIFYSADGSTLNKQWFYSGMNRVELSSEVEFKPLSATPFVNLSIPDENFETTAEFASYGAQR